jgi:hypothetical protein
MAVALDIASSLALFQNALIYTIAASSVTALVDTADTSSTLLVILTIALIVTAAHTVSANLPQLATETKTGWVCGVCRRKCPRGACPTCPFSMRLQLRLGPLLELVHFLVATVANVLMQFESTLVARMMITTLSPSAVAIEWVVLYVITAASLLWLVTHAATA